VLGFGYSVVRKPNTQDPDSKTEEKRGRDSGEY
jgi:hypothetical protein